MYTVCFSGTACTRDEGEATRADSDKRIYDNNSGYIPVRVHKEISGDLRATQPSVTVRGVGENDWAQPRNNSEALVFNAPLNAPGDLVKYVRDYSGGDQKSRGDQLSGWAAAALALHGANLAAASNAQTYNFLGHSRGAVECIMAAWFLYAYGPRQVPVNIFAIDPVPGPGNWYGILTQLPPNVTEYVGVYAWDHLDQGFNAVVPRPNGRMTGKSDNVRLGGGWSDLADDYQLTDPLAANGGNLPQPVAYKLYACRGRHGTVAGNTTGDGLYDPAKVNASVAPVPQLIYRIARGYLTKWGSTFRDRPAVDRSAVQLRQFIHRYAAKVDAMGGGVLRTSSRPFGRPYVRQVSSIMGRNPYNTYYLEDVVGEPPYRLAYPVTSDRTGAGWVKWSFL